MAESITILPKEWRGRHMRVPIAQITVKEGRAREPDLSAEATAKLAESIRRAKGCSNRSA